MGNVYGYIRVGCLNSPFIKKYWKAKYSDNKALFSKIKGFQLKELPIPIVSTERQSIVAALVDKVLEVKQTDINSDANSIEEQIDCMIDSMYT